MNGLILIELMSLVSYIFSLLIFIFSNKTMNNFMIIFLWMILVSYLGVHLKKKNKRYLHTSILMLLPAIKYHTVSDILFLCIATFLIYYYIFQYFGDMNFGFIKEDFIKKLAFYTIIILINFIYKFYDKMQTNHVLFMILYFISTIIFLRSLRHLEYDSNIKRISKTNSIYAIIMSVASLVFSIDKLKNGFVVGMKTAYSFITNLAFKILYWPLVFFGGFWEYLVKIIWQGGEVNMDLDLEPKSPQTDEEIADIFKRMLENDSGLPIWLTKLLSIVSKLLIIILIIYLIKRVLKKYVLYNKKEEKAYIEEREYIDIKDEKAKKERISIFEPRDIGEKIRYYYKKYLIKIQKKGINIENSDTSLDINMKAEGDFDKKGIKELRDIYIETRYGEKEANETMAEDVKRLYKKI